jgi:cellulose synthase/poly-beta-1,6-N-acetylglucosamine synthase-like glycosyltransferase
VTFQPAILTIFWLSLAAVAYVYFSYPFLLRLGLFGRPKPLNLGPVPAELPMISVIIAARNEEAGIEAKLRNLLASAYPRERVEILVGSDGSSDRTESIVRPLASEGVGLISFPIHQGKSAMQNRLVAAASGSILVFTDADCILTPDALDHLVSNFRDPAVGLVTGRPVYLNRSATDITENETGYLRYETNIRSEESARGILAVASGSLFALRRSLWKPLDSNLGDDFVLPLHVAKSGFRNILEPRAVAATRLTQSSPASMLRLKRRIVGKDFRALLAEPGMLNPFRQGRTAIGLWSHKLLRWFVPYFLIAILVSAIFLSAHPIFRIFSVAQIAFYVIALAGLLPHKRTIRSPWSIPASFCIVNLAALLGTMKSLTGRASGRWDPERKPPSIESAQQGAAFSPQSK